MVKIGSPSTLREFRGQDARTLRDLKSQNPESKSGPSILRGSVATIGAIGKNPDRKVHWHIGIRQIANPEDKRLGYFMVKTSILIRTVHHRRMRGGDRRNREISRKEKSPIGKSEFERSGIPWTRGPIHFDI
jgi:hypothetical protein